MNKANNKGFTLIELVMTVAITAIVIPLVFLVLSYCTRSQSTAARYIRQHDRVVDVIQRIRKDVEEAKKVSADAVNNSISIVFPDGASEQWSFSDSALKLNGTEVVKNLDTSSSGSSFRLSGDGLILTVIPEKTNTDQDREKNVWEPIITEFSVRYKK